MKNRIKSLREANGLTQKELGARVGVSRQAVDAVETGKSAPSLRLAHALAAYFGASIEKLFDFSEGGV